MGENNIIEMNNKSEWQVTPIAGALGAQVSGIDLSSISNNELQQLRTLLVDKQVLFFPQQNLTNEAHIELGRTLADLEGGYIEGHPNISNQSELPAEIFELRASAGGVADEWHTDLTFQDSPSILSILHMITCPEVGGDTMWTSLIAAYEALSEPMKHLCDGLSALHDALPHNHPEQTAIHPVVRVHPISGKKALYVSEHFTRRIVELNAGESNALLSFLTRWVSSPQFTVRYNWAPGTIAIWDNRCTQHFVLNDFQGERIIQRVTVMGDKVQAPPSAISGNAATAWKPAIRTDRLTATSRFDRQLYMHLKAEGKTAKE